MYEIIKKTSYICTLISYVKTVPVKAIIAQQTNALFICTNCL